MPHTDPTPQPDPEHDWPQLPPRTHPALYPDANESGAPRSARRLRVAGHNHPAGPARRNRDTPPQP